VSYILSIVHYREEHWGYGNFIKCDNVINRAIPYLFGVHRFVSMAESDGAMAIYEINTLSSDAYILEKINQNG